MTGGLLANLRNIFHHFTRDQPENNHNDLPTACWGSNKRRPQHFEPPFFHGKDEKHKTDLASKRIQSDSEGFRTKKLDPEGEEKIYEEKSDEVVNLVMTKILKMKIEAEIRRTLLDIATLTV